jgi:hypothetical protein
LDPESNVIQLHSNENSVADTSESNFEITGESSTSASEDVESESYDELEDDSFSDESGEMTFTISDNPEDGQ